MDTQNSKNSSKSNFGKAFLNHLKNCAHNLIPAKKGAFKNKFIILISILVGLKSLAAYYNLGAFWKSQAPPAQIYRSIGPTNTGILACGTGCGTAIGNLTATGTTATFASALPTNIGVGDAIVYDCSGNAALGAGDCIAFIAGRTSSTVYTIQNTSGGSATSYGAANVWRIYRAYTSLQNAFDGTENTSISGIDATLGNFDSGPRDITAGSGYILNFACYADATDSHALINGYTTSASKYIRIYTPYLSTEVGTTQRHLGYWNSGGYLIQDSQEVLNIDDDFVKVEGLRVQHTNSNNSESAIAVDQISATAQVYIYDNLINASGTFGGQNNGIVIWVGVQGGARVYIYNNVISNYTCGLCNGIYNTTDIVSYIYNNTIYNAYNHSIYTISATTKSYMKNNIMGASIPTLANQAIVSDAGWDSNSDYNITNDASGPGQTHDIQNAIVNFKDPANLDFRLADNEIYARDNGVDLSTDANLAFSTDAATSARTGTWDRGAIESSTGTAIYRSVGTNASALQTGAGNNLTISGNTATFASAIANNIGVGDVIQYDSDNNGSIDALAFISGRYSSTSYKVQNVSGGTPTATAAADQDWGIYHAYESLWDAEAGIENTGINASLQNFDTWTGGANLTTGGGKTWNIACYNDGIDTLQVVIDGWTTSAQNYLRIFTPTSSTEVGTSQRHNGKWSTSGYRLEVDTGSMLTGGVIDINSKYVRIEGLQIFLTTTGGNYYVISFCNNPSCAAGASDYYLSDNIFKEKSTMALVAGEALVDLYQDPINTNVNMYVKNNILYSTNVRVPTGIWIGSSVGSIYLYNNTIKKVVRGIEVDNPTTVAKNNLVQDSSDDAYHATSNFDSASDYNISDDSTTTGGANDKASSTVTFVDSANSDFRLSTRDTVAFGAGVNLSTDSVYPFNNDIQNLIRATPWDIGASMPVSPVSSLARYRSVGGAASLASGTSSTLSVIGNVAIFTNPLPNTVGIGDVLQYDSAPDNVIDANDTLALVRERISSTKLFVARSNGSTPVSYTGTSGLQSWNIYRAYTTLPNALSGTENTSIDTDIRDFDTLPKDLVAANEQWNIVTYTGTDTTGATVDTWNTDATRFLKIFSPRGPNFYESGQSYRHQGVRDSNIYELSQTAANTTPTLLIDDTNVQVEGLQLRSANNTANKPNIRIGSAAGAIATATAEVKIINNLLSATWTSGVHGTILTGPTANLNASANIKVYDNILYSNGGGSAYIMGTGGTHYIYNNTAVNYTLGFNASALSGARATLKNNIVQNTSGNNYPVGANCTNCTNNLAGDTNAPGTNPQNSKTVNFVDSANYNFLLDSTDSAAINAGTNASDAYITFSTDILGATRPIGMLIRLHQL